MRLLSLLTVFSKQEVHFATISWNRLLEFMVSLVQYFTAYFKYYTICCGAKERPKSRSQWEVFCFSDGRHSVDDVSKYFHSNWALYSPFIRGVNIIWMSYLFTLLLLMPRNMKRSTLPGRTKPLIWTHQGNTIVN